MAGAWQVPEILEAILLHLDMADLLLSANRVSRTWHDVVNNTPSLRRVLHFDPYPTPTPAPAPGTTSSSPPSRPALVPNPLLVKSFAPCFFDSPTNVYPDDMDIGWFRRAHAFHSMPWVAHPRREHLNSNRLLEALPPHPALDPSRPADAADRRRFTVRGASWRRMLVSDPPPPRLACAWHDGTTLAHAVTLADPLDAAGLRMGQLYDFLQHHAAHHPDDCLWFRVLWGRWREPCYCPTSRRIAERFLEDPGFAVEIIESRRDLFVKSPDPVDPAAFDAVFRCDELEDIPERGSPVATAEPSVPQLYLLTSFWMGRVI